MTEEHARELLRGGSILVLTHSEFGDSYWLEPGGEISDRLARMLISTRMRPKDDALFIGEEPQSWVWIPRRVKLSRAKGSKRPRGIIAVDRRSHFGNPFKVGTEYVRSKMEPGGGQATGFVQDAAHAVALYKRYTSREMFTRIASFIVLRGKDLGCWCDLCEKHKDGKPMGEKRSRGSR